MAGGAEYCRIDPKSFPLPETLWVLPPLPLSNFFLGLLFSAIISIAAYLRGSLAPSGVLGAIVVGTIVFAAGGRLWAILLIAFFLTSSALSHYKSRVKEPIAEKFQKGYRRDLGQVLANGGAAALCGVVYAFAPQVVFAALIGAIATVTADTWATELGVLSTRQPRLITDGRVVPAGTSGGVTLLGTVAALGGAVFIGLIVAFDPLWYGLENALLGMPFIDLPMFFAILPNRIFTFVPLAAISGLAGSFFDSFLGATVQAIYFCDYDQKETESRVHRCGRATRFVRGWRWLDNDWVNFLASVLGSVIAATGYWVIR